MLFALKPSDGTNDVLLCSPPSRFSCQPTQVPSAVRAVTSRSPTAYISNAVHIEPGKLFISKNNYLALTEETYPARGK